MDIQHKSENNILIVKFMEPRLDIRTSRDLPAKISKLIEDGHTRMALDISQLEFIDSTGLATLITMMRSLGEKGRLVVFGPKKHILNLFQLTRLDRFFHLVPTEEGAVKLLS